MTRSTSREAGGSRARRSLAQQPLDAVALDGAADLARDGQPDARLVGVARIARERVDDEVPRRGRAAPPVDGVEVSRAREAPAARSRDPPRPRPTGACGRAAAALEDGAARARSSCACGSRASLRACAYWAGRCASRELVGSAGRETGSVAADAGRRSRTRRACGQPLARGGEAPVRSRSAVGCAARAPLCLWMTLWISQECPQRAVFAAAVSGRAPVRGASIRSPRPVRTVAIDTRLAPWTSVAMPVDLRTRRLWTATSPTASATTSRRWSSAPGSRPRGALALDGDVLEVGVPNEFTRAWIEGHFARARRARRRARRRPGVVGALPRRRRR